MQASALAGFEDRWGEERERGKKDRGGDGSPYTWAGGEEGRVQPNVTRRPALTLQHAPMHVVVELVDAHIQSEKVLLGMTPYGQS